MLLIADLKDSRRLVGDRRQFFKGRIIRNLLLIWNTRFAFNVVGTNPLSVAQAVLFELFSFG